MIQVEIEIYDKRQKETTYHTVLLENHVFELWTTEKKTIRDLRKQGIKIISSKEVGNDNKRSE